MWRTALQLLLSVAVLPLYPFVLILTAAIFTPKFWNEAPSFTLENWVLFLIYPAAAIGIPALIISIFVAPAAIRQRTGLARYVFVGLAAGACTAVTFMAVSWPGMIDDGQWRGLAMSAWQLAGPLLVASWNFVRLWQHPRPTPAATAA